MKRLIFLSLLIALHALAQNPATPLPTTATNPNGQACQSNAILNYVPSGVIYTCQNGFMAVATSGSGISTCATNPPTTGTAGQVCVIGTSQYLCPTTGSCSFPGDWTLTGPGPFTRSSGGVISPSVPTDSVEIGNSVLQETGANLISADQSTPATPSVGTTAFYSKSGTMCSKSPAGVESCGFGGTGLSLGNLIGGSPTANAILYGDGSGNLQNALGITRTGPAQLTLGTATNPGNSITLGTTATDSATLGSELTTSGTCSGTGWTGTYPNYIAPGTTAPLTCTGFISGQFYQTVTTIGAGGSGAVTIAIGTAQTASGSSGTVTAGLKANGTSLTYTPASTYTGTVGISAKLITPISLFSYTGKDSTGAVSFQALYQGLASLYNSFSGGGGSYNTTGNNNSAQGYTALYSNTTGNNNSAQGVNALFSNTTGNYNSAQGVDALYYNTTGSSNSAQGYTALNHNTTGSNNSAQGVNALNSNTTGSSNSAQGASALNSNTTGSSNSAPGYQAGYTAVSANANVSGSYNSWFGYNSGPGSPTQYSYQSVVGAAATATCSNCVVLGRAGGLDTVYAGDAGVDPMVVVALATTPVLTTNLKTCTATTGIPWRASVTDAVAPALGVALTGGGLVFANVHCSLTTGTYIVDGI